MPLAWCLQYLLKEQEREKLLAMGSQERFVVFEMKKMVNKCYNYIVCSFVICHTSKNVIIYTKYAACLYDDDYCFDLPFFKCVPEIAGIQLLPLIFLCYFWIYCIRQCGTCLYLRTVCFQEPALFIDLAHFLKEEQISRTIKHRNFILYTYVKAST